eukprot:jgi/Tetstr1/438126/TSEL_002852.t1
MTQLDSPSTLISSTPEDWSASGWKLGDVIGRGSYATVRRAANIRTGAQAAVKVISKEHEDNTTEAIAEEVRVLRAVSTSLQYSSSFTKLQAVYEDPWNVYLLLDLCHGGSLADRIAQQQTFTEREAQGVARQLLAALRQLHSLNLVHCDIKPENLLFARLKSLEDLKVTDFGLSQSTNADTDYSVMGSPYYVAPEVLTRQLYSPSCDVWATGILVYKMLCGRVPFPNEEKIKQNQLRFYDEVWASVSADAKSFIAACLTKDHKTRASVADLVRHPWLASAEHNEAVLPPPPIKELKPVKAVKVIIEAAPLSPTRMSLSSDEGESDRCYIAARSAAPISLKSPRSPGKSARQRRLAMDKRLSLMLLGRGLR